ncbi:WD40 repeat domain-containing protein, partial [Streptomyces sp. NPDC059010]|uniref:WD40 repeat domain-containing protein n=1 Tax=Streptomyces sp. NPDC059010 TaxID=3346695 RepID=UPI00369DD41B
GIRLWDREAGRWLDAPKSTAGVIDFGAGGRLYMESDVGDDRVRLRSVTDGRPLFDTSAPSPTDVAPSADGRLVAVCPAGKAPQVRELAHDRVLHGAWERAGALCDERSTLVFAQGGRFVVLGDGKTHVWDTASGRSVADLDAPGAEYPSFDEDGAFLAAVQGGEIKVWRLAAPTAPVFRHPLNNQSAYGTLAWDPDRPRLRYLEGGTVHTLDLGAAVTSTWVSRPAETLLSPDGRTLATAEPTGATYRVRLRDAGDGQVIRTLPTPPPPAPRDRAEPAATLSELRLLMAFSQDGTTLAYGLTVSRGIPAAQRLTFWDLARRRERTTLELPTSADGELVESLALGPGGRSLYVTRATSIGEYAHEVWDTARHRRTAVFPGATGTDLAVRPDGRLLVGDDRVARLPSGPVTRKELAQGTTIGALAFAPDGSRLAAGDLTGRVSLWDADVRHRAGVLRNVFPAPLGDTPEGVGALALSPDGRTLAVGGDAGTLQLWDTSTQQPLGGPLTTPGDAVRSLAFSPDGTTLYSTGAHVPLQRYTVAPDRAATQVCARAAHANLTKAQWRTYIPDAPYRELCGD